MSEALRELLSHLIDYAGMFPPARLDLATATRNYDEYRQGEHAWMLNRFVVPKGVDAPFPLAIVDGKTERASLVEYSEVLVGQATQRVPRPAGPLKIRTGGATYPTTEELAGFLLRAATAKVPFKATAGLHHALPHPPMHGFINLFLAAALVWNGGSEEDAVATLNERTFHFDDDARWSTYRLSAGQIQDARTNFAISFGSCSFEEPVSDLKELGWLNTAA